MNIPTFFIICVLLFNNNTLIFQYANLLDLFQTVHQEDNQFMDSVRYELKNIIGNHPNELPERSVRPVRPINSKLIFSGIVDKLLDKLSENMIEELLGKVSDNMFVPNDIVPNDIVPNDIIPNDIVSDNIEYYILVVQKDKLDSGELEGIEGVEGLEGLEVYYEEDIIGLIEIHH